MTKIQSLLPVNTVTNSYTSYENVGITTNDLYTSLISSNSFDLAPGSVKYTGADSAASIFQNLSIGGSELAKGILLTSGSGTPGTVNTYGDYTEFNNQPGDEFLTSVVSSFFPEGPESFDASVLEFDILVTDTSVKSVFVDILFGSEEYPEYSSDFVDIGVFAVNGQNYAKFSNGKELSVIDDNLGFFRDNLNGSLETEYDGISKKLAISAPVVQGLNRIKIAVGDTEDEILDSGMFLSNMRTSSVEFEGLLVQIDSGAEISANNTLTGEGNNNEYFDGGAGNDNINAGAGDDIIYAGSGDDTVFAGTGNDTIIGGNGKGNDIYNGDSGIDSIIYSSANNAINVDLSKGTAWGVDIDQDQLFNIENIVSGQGNDILKGNAGDNVIDGAKGIDVYLANYFPSQYSLVDGVLSGADGKDTLSNIEYIGFGYDQPGMFAMNVAIADLIDPVGDEKSKLATQIDKLSDLYIAYFGRAPDPEGLSYWAKELYTGALSYNAIAKSFAEQDEYKATYPSGETNQEFVQSIYQNLFNREADTDGLNYWADQLDNQMPKDTFILSVINGAYSPTGGAEDKALLSNKHDVSVYYVEQSRFNQEQGFDASIIQLLTHVSDAQGTANSAKKIIDYAFDNELTITGIADNQALWDSIWTG